VYHDDDATQECFRSYSSPADSYTDHSDFLKNSPRYSFLFSLDPVDYKAWALGLKKAGYATNNAYSQILIKLIEEYNLQQYTLIAMGKLQPQDENLTVMNKPVAGNTVNRMPDGIVTGQEGENAVIHQYPGGEFMINNTRVVFVKAGTALLAVAKQYDIPLSRLLDFNDLKEEDVLTRDQLLFLQRKRKSGASEFHIVQRGELVYDICQSEGIRMESLLQYNHLDPLQEPAAGEKLYLHTDAPSKPKLAAETLKTGNIVFIDRAVTSASAATTHIVQNNETLNSIAKKYGITAAKLKAWNKLPGYEVKTGQELIIYKD